MIRICINNHRKHARTCEQSNNEDVRKHEAQFSFRQLQPPNIDSLAPNLQTIKEEKSD